MPSGSSSPLLPASLRSRKRLDDRRVLNGIVWKFRTGVAWRDVPERYGSWATLHTRFADGPGTGPSRGCSGPRRRKPMRQVTSTGWCVAGRGDLPGRLSATSGIVRRRRLE
ncbi:transposase [Streptomyces violascens]|uniref:transposase n=1 Tax=Streptomyces violascens TaxID=67381 RepID=UPI00365FF2E3